MTRTQRLLASASVLAAASFTSSPAFAAGTTSGTTITNTVTLNYKVGGVDQTAVNASDSFLVDRKVSFTVSEIGSATTSVSPGETNVVTTFQVANSSNAAIDVALAATQLSGGTTTHGGTDNFDVTAVKIYIDTNANGTFDSGTDTQITYVDQLAADSQKTVFVVANVPQGRSTGDVAGVKLSGTASEATAAGSLGATITATSGANTANAVDTVLAEANAANGNTAYDGIDFAFDDYTVLAAALTVTKTSRVVSDPVNGSTNPKAIPGATVEYCIAVANASGSATATNISVSDTLPAETTFVASSIKVDGTMTGSTCNADGAAGGSYAAGVVSGSLSNVAAGSARTLVFRVTVN
ncbi:MAG: hypothetical protein QOH04_497 [Sphingomonadales bacterium]|jgi:uncharacterized repeat protein (TIGR01451 family)|nr:hypothetical protein [Sphingomonadales bacterium]MEA3034738.1 hypothetical protein [Sphingomonadales bacterium]